VHPFVSAIDTELPKAPSTVHLLLRDKASWVEPQIGPNDDCFDGYPKLSIEDWHKKHVLWIEWHLPRSNGRWMPCSQPPRGAPVRPT
jgi:hypothetical protein